MPLQNKSLAPSSNGATHTDLKAKPTVTFAPTPRASSNASSSVPPQVPNRQLPSDASSAAGSATRGQKREYDGQGDVNDGEGHGNAGVSKTNDPGQPVRKRGREAPTGTRQASTKKSTSTVPSESEPQMAVDPLCVGHKPGDIWESGNMRFKVGQDGRRLRAGNVKERRPKYHMVRFVFLHSSHLTSCRLRFG